MYLDVVDIKRFYEQPLGLMVRQLVGMRVRSLWPDLRGKNIMSLGYATPYLRPYLPSAERIVAFMPAPQGVTPWPPEGPNRASLVDEHSLPLPDACIDRALLVHALDMSGDSLAVLREVWRVLVPGGRLLAVVPNRRSLWSQFETTPFGYGRPFSRAQLASSLREARFTPTANHGALYLPPCRNRLLIRSAGGWEKLGARLWPAFSGVLMMEAEKQMYQTLPSAAEESATARILRPVFISDTPPHGTVRRR